MTGTDLVDAARRALDAAHENPGSALDAALDVLARANGDREVMALAQWAAGLAHRELNHLAQADESLVRAVEQATVVGRADIAAGARTSRALVLVYQGRPDEGLAELDAAEPHLTGAELGRARMQRALIQQRLGDIDEAIAGFGAALPDLVAGGDRLAEVRLRLNRGIAHAYRGDFLSAEDDLRQAQETARSLGQAMLAAGAAHNLGFVSGRRGDVPAALRWFDMAAAEYRDLGVDSGLSAVLLVDRATVLLDAGLIAEAVEVSARAVDLLAPTGNSVELAEARLLAARAAFAGGDPDTAVKNAESAAADFAATERATWSVLAGWIAAQAAHGSAHDTAALAVRLADAGWAVEAAAAHGLAGELALASGEDALARAELEWAATARTGGSAAARVAGWHAEALRHHLAGDRRGERRAVRTGLDELRRHRATLGATDLRAHSARYGERLAELGVADALAHGTAADLLHAAEAWRAGSLTTPAVPPEDPELAAALGRLRAATARRREEPGADADRSLREVEDQVRDLVRARPGDLATPLAPIEPLERGRLGDALGDRVLVEWVVHRGTLLAVVVDGGRARRHALGRLDDLRAEIGSIRMCLQRLAVGAGSQRSLDAARATVAAAGATLTSALFGPVAPKLRGRELVLVPTGPLHAIPWLALDALRSLSVSVTPSARSWLRAAGRPRRPGVLLAAGPRLPGAAAEIAALARALPEATVLQGANASVDAVLAQLGEVGVAHLAAHGRFRSDNPQFSALELADGDLTVYDLETLTHAPQLLVLSACDAAATGVRSGDELLGLSAALLAAGAGALIAPSVPVPDDATAELMVTLQLFLSAGRAPAAALRDAITAMGEDGDARSFAALRSFVTWGA